jgi:hypothetical protein
MFGGWESVDGQRIEEWDDERGKMCTRGGEEEAFCKRERSELRS